MLFSCCSEKVLACESLILAHGFKELGGWEHFGEERDVCLIEKKEDYVLCKVFLLFPFCSVWEAPSTPSRQIFLSQLTLPRSAFLSHPASLLASLLFLSLGKLTVKIGGHKHFHLVVVQHIAWSEASKAT